MSFFKLIALEERIVLDATYFVAAAAAPGGDGSQAHPYNDLQSALNQVNLDLIANPANRDTINMTAGTYLPTQTDLIANRGNVSFIIPDNTTINGGFNADFSQRNPDLYVTLLSGDLNNNGFADHGDAFHVVTLGSNTVATANADVTLDGLSIAHGYADGAISAATTARGRGGGIYSSGNLELNLNDVHLYDNWAIATVANTQGGIGGAVFIAVSAPQGPLNTVIHFNVTDSLFTDNMASKRGGAFFALSAALPTYVATHIENSIFESNQAYGNIYTGIIGQGGAGYFQGGTYTILNSQFSHNSAFENGGALALANFAGVPFGDNYIQGSQFIDNHVQVNGGGAIAGINNILAGTLYIQDSHFSENSASSGGAVYLNAVKSVLTNDTFVDNTQRYGGALFVHSATTLFSLATPQAVTVSNSSFVNNISTGGPLSAAEMLDYTAFGQLVSPEIGNVGGGAIGVFWNGIISIDNSRFVNNSAPNGGAIMVGTVPAWITTAPFIYGNPITLVAQLSGSGTLSVNHSEFVNNRATNGDGGAILAKAWSFPADTNFSGYPAFTLTAPITFSLTNSSLTNNRATGNGGALGIMNSTAVGASNLMATITGNLFSNNNTDLLGDSVYNVNSTINGATSAPSILSALVSSNTFKKLDADDIVTGI